jgi:hypothetical protein
MVDLRRDGTPEQSAPKPPTFSRDWLVASVPAEHRPMVAAAFDLGYATAVRDAARDAGEEWAEERWEEALTGAGG